MEAPSFPVGPFVPHAGGGKDQRAIWVGQIAAAPGALSRATEGLSTGALDTRYRNWTVRQIVHHVADSHVNSYVRFKWALTEDRPTIKAYDEGAWAALADAQEGPIEAPLALLDGLHHCWVDLLQRMSADDFTRTFIHPETGSTVTLTDALAYYVWHGRHHTGQVIWLRQRYGW